VTAISLRRGRDIRQDDLHAAVSCPGPFDLRLPARYRAQQHHRGRGVPPRLWPRRAGRWSARPRRCAQRRVPIWTSAIRCGATSTADARVSSDRTEVRPS